MDTKTLLAEAKARFNHNFAKDYLKEKFNTKLIVADQGGLWRADSTTINFLALNDEKEIILVDSFDNPVKVDRLTLLSKLRSTYQIVMNDWYAEWCELEKKR